jgi:hypothetical protein
MASECTTRLCSLEATVGRLEACPEGECPFWEPGGAALGGRCAFEELDITADPPLAAWLLEIRERLAMAESTVGAEAARSLFCHLLNGIARVTRARAGRARGRRRRGRPGSAAGASA